MGARHPATYVLLAPHVAHKPRLVQAPPCPLSKPRLVQAPPCPSPALSKPRLVQAPPCPSPALSLVQAPPCPSPALSKHRLVPCPSPALSKPRLVPCPSPALSRPRLVQAPQLEQLDLVHRTALGLTNWNLTMPILLLPPSEGGWGQASLSAYAQWAHSHSFVKCVLRPGRFAEQHSGPFRRWAAAQGLLMEEEFLPYLQLGPVPLSRPSFLQGCLKAYSVTRRWGGGRAAPPGASVGAYAGMA